MVVVLRKKHMQWPEYWGGNHTWFSSFLGKGLGGRGLCIKPRKGFELCIRISPSLCIERTSEEGTHLLTLVKFVQVSVTNLYCFVCTCCLSHDPEDTLV